MNGGLALQHNHVTFQDGGLQESKLNDQNIKTNHLNVNYIERIIKFGLLM